MKSSMGGSSKLKIELPYNSETPLLGIYPNKTLIQKDAGTPVFTAAKTGNNLNGRQADEWMKTWSTYTMEYHLATEKDEIISAVVGWT